MSKNLKYVVGICGNARTCGKSTATNILSEHLLKVYDSVNAVFEFGDLIRKECSEASGIPVEKFNDPQLKEVTRPFLQWWGMFKRNPDLGGYADYWIDKMYKQIDSLSDDYEGVIISSVSLDTEAQFIKRSGLHKNIKFAATVKVHCPELEFGTKSTHPTDRGISSHLINYTVNSDKTVGPDSIRSGLGPIILNLVKEAGLLPQ